MTDGPEVQEWDDEWLVRRGVYLTLVTPDKASELLERNTNNRKIKPYAVRDYAAAMTAGQWDADASDLKFSRTGELIDGQNRLHACVAAGVPFATWVRTGLSLDTKRRIDIGVKRSIGDSFAMEGKRYALETAASISLRLRYEQRESMGQPVGAPGGGRAAVRLNPDVALSYAAEHPMHEKLAPFSDQLYRALPAISRTVWITFMAMAAEQHEGMAVDFVQSIIDGANPSPQALAVMRYAAATRQVPYGARLRNVNERHVLALVRAWNALRLGDKLDRIVIKDDDQVVPVV